LYDYVLEDEQIREMYNQTKDAHVTIIEEELNLEKILAQMTE